MYQLEEYYPRVRSDRELPAATTARPVANWELRTTRGLIANGQAEQLPGERHELFEPQRLVAQFRPERADLGRLRVVEIVVAGDDGHWCVGQAGYRTDGAKKLQSAGE